MTLTLNIPDPVLLLGDTNFRASAEVIDRLRRTIGAGGPFGAAGTRLRELAKDSARM